MPKAAVNKDRLHAGRENQVGAPRQLADVQPVPISQRTDQAPHGFLRSRALAANPRHHEAAFFLIERVHFMPRVPLSAGIRYARSARVNIVVTSAADDDEVVRIVPSPLRVRFDMMQLEKSRIRCGPVRHTPAAHPALVGVALIDRPLDIDRNMTVVGLGHGIAREVNVFSHPEVRSSREAPNNSRFISAECAHAQASTKPRLQR